MNIHPKLKLLLFYFLAIAYIAIFFSSIYGLFVDEIRLFGIVLQGWEKNALSLTGLFIVCAISVYPVLLTMYNVFKQCPDNSDRR